MTLQRTKMGTGYSAFDLGMELMGVQEIFLVLSVFLMFHFRALCLTVYLSQLSVALA
jgi:hypothetical protein